MNSLLTVSVCIPAYNEGQAIRQIIEDCVAQEQEGFVIEKVIVISDGSSDNTVEIARSVKDSRVVVIDDGLRKGKNGRLTDFSEYCESDFIVHIDADMTVKDKRMVYHLIEPMLKDASIGLVSGHTVPLAPTTFSEKVAYTGIELWMEVKVRYGSPMYLSEGQIRAMRKRFYKQVIFPKASADDAYVYLRAVELREGFAWAKNAIAYYVLPKTFSDYVLQMKRFLKSQSVVEQYFDHTFVAPFYNLNWKHKSRVMFEQLFRNPFWVSMYLIYLVFPKFLVLFSAHNSEAVWHIIESTKNIHG